MDTSAMSFITSLAATIWIGVSFDLLFWTLGFYTITIILKNAKLRYWLLLGAIVGLGLLNKISMLWFSAGLAAGLILTQSRSLLLTKGAWLAALIAICLFVPHIVWQVQHDWPTLEFMRNATSIKMADNPPSKFILQQARSMSYFTLPIWIAGLFFYFSKRGSLFRPLGWIYVFT
ncbi:MAG TPA: glycosyltransferase family 39 protein, partial [Acidobacteriota bacterium]|nr:glycosyltransferase family 39 protein [Acidobacteriota bacterium]